MHLILQIADIAQHMNCSMFIFWPDPDALTGILTVPIDGTSEMILTTFLASSILRRDPEKLEFKLDASRRSLLHLRFFYKGNGKLKPWKCSEMSTWQESLHKLISLPKIDESSSKYKLKMCIWNNIILVSFPNELEIVEIVESLQPFMTHSDPGIRGKGKWTAFSMI